MPADAAHVEREIKPFLTPEEVASILRLSVRTITGGVCRKALPWIKVGGVLRMREEDLLEFARINHGSLLEKRQKMLGIRLPVEKTQVPRVRIPNEKSSPSRRRRRPRRIEAREVFSVDEFSSV